MIGVKVAKPENVSSPAVETINNTDNAHCIMCGLSSRKDVKGWRKLPTAQGRRLFFYRKETLIMSQPSQDQSNITLIRQMINQHEYVACFPIDSQLEQRLQQYFEQL